MARLPSKRTEGLAQPEEGLGHSGPLFPRVRDGPGPTQGRNSDLDTKHVNLDLSMGKSPINTAVLCNYLKEYPNERAAKILKDGFSNGFRLGYTGSKTGFEAKNLQSVRSNPRILRQKIDKEVDLGRLAGPFKSPPFPNLKISPVGLIEKPGGGYRLITHLSHPEGQSVNDGISDETSSVSLLLTR